MILNKCPKCGCTHIWKNSICSACGFNTRIYIKQLIEDTRSMNDNECKKYISDSIMIEEGKEQIICDILKNMDFTIQKQYYSQPIIQCPACGKDISSEAEICVHCGYPLRKKLIEQGVLKKPATPSQPSQPTSTSTASNLVRCPKCGSTSVTTEEQGYGLFGWIGASQKKNLCQKCGYKWWPGR